MTGCLSPFIQRFSLFGRKRERRRERERENERMRKRKIERKRVRGEVIKRL